MINKRAEFQMIYDQYKALGKGDVRISESTLIIAQLINNQASTYKFPITINDGALVLPTEEIRLDINDEFVMTEMGFFFRGLLTDSVAGGTAPVWLSSAPFEKESTQVTLETLYAGRLNISVNNVVYMQNWDMRKHEYKGITQIADYSAGIPNATWYANNFNENSMIPVVPTLKFSGAMKNDPVVTLPNAINPLPIATNFQAGNNQPVTLSVTHIYMVARGWLAQNAAKFQQ